MISRALALALPAKQTDGECSHLAERAHAVTRNIVSALDRYLNRIDCTGLHMRGRAAGRCLHAHRGHTPHHDPHEAIGLLREHRSHSIPQITLHHTLDSLSAPHRVRRRTDSDLKRSHIQLVACTPLVSPRYGAGSAAAAPRRRLGRPRSRAARGASPGARWPVRLASVCTALSVPHPMRMKPTVCRELPRVPSASLTASSSTTRPHLHHPRHVRSSDPPSSHDLHVSIRSPRRAAACAPPHARPSSCGLIRPH